jgi:hypothetical protein
MIEAELTQDLTLLVDDNHIVMIPGPIEPSEVFNIQPCFH